MRKGFISYSHADREICDALFKQLGPISRSQCSFWRDPDLKAGSAWNTTISWHVNRCHIALILLSADALKAGGFIVDIELPKLRRRTKRRECHLIAVTARIADFSEFGDLAHRQIIPRSKEGRFFVLGPDASRGESDQWCAAVVDELRDLLDALPPLDEHDNRVSQAIQQALDSLATFEDSDAFAALDGDRSNDFEKQMSGVKGALRSPQADFWYMVNAMRASWEGKVARRIENDPALGIHASAVSLTLATLDKLAEEVGYDWPPDKERAEVRDLIPVNDVREQVQSLHTQLDRIETEANFLAQPGRQPATSIVGVVSDKVAVARALTNGLEVDGEGASEALLEADRQVQSGEIELSAMTQLEGGKQDQYNLSRLRMETIQGSKLVGGFTKPAKVAAVKVKHEKWELEAAVSILKGQPIPPERKPHLRSLALSGDNAQLFEALRKSGARLSAFYADENEGLRSRRLLFWDLSPLQELTALESLDLWRTQVNDLSPLRNLKALASLNLTGTQVNDVAPLQNLTALRSLSLKGTRVSNLEPVEHVEHLTMSDGTVRKGRRAP